MFITQCFNVPLPLLDYVSAVCAGRGGAHTAPVPGRQHGPTPRHPHGQLLQVQTAARPSLYQLYCSFSSGLVSSILFMPDIFIFKVKGLKF